MVLELKEITVEEPKLRGRQHRYGSYKGAMRSYTCPNCGKVEKMAYCNDPCSVCGGRKHVCTNKCRNSNADKRWLCLDCGHVHKPSSSQMTRLHPKCGKCGSLNVKKFWLKDLTETLKLVKHIVGKEEEQ